MEKIELEELIERYNIIKKIYLYHFHLSQYNWCLGCYEPEHEHFERVALKQLTYVRNEIEKWKKLN